MNVSLRITIYVLILIEGFHLQTASDEEPSSKHRHFRFSLVLPSQLKQLLLVRVRNGSDVNDSLTKMNSTFDSDYSEIAPGIQPYENVNPYHSSVQLNNKNLTSGIQFVITKPPLRRCPSHAKGKLRANSKLPHSNHVICKQDAARKQKSRNIREAPFMLWKTFGVVSHDKPADSGNISRKSKPIDDASSRWTYENMQPIYKDYRRTKMPSQVDEDTVAETSNDFDEHRKHLIFGQTYGIGIHSRRYDVARDDNPYKKIGSSRTSAHPKERDDSVKANADLMTFARASVQKIKEKNGVKDNFKGQRRARSNAQEWQNDGDVENNKNNLRTLLDEAPDYYYEYFSGYDDFPHGKQLPYVNHQNMASGDVKQVETLGNPDSDGETREQQAYSVISSSSDRAKRRPICIECPLVRDPQSLPPWILKTLPPTRQSYEDISIQTHNKVKPIEIRIRDWKLKKLRGNTDIIQNRTSVDNVKHQGDPLLYPDQGKDPRIDYKNLNTDFTDRKDEPRTNIENSEFRLLQLDPQLEDKAVDIPPSGSSPEVQYGVARDEKPSSFLEAKKDSPGIYGQRTSYSMPSAFKSVANPQFYRKFNSYFKKMYRNRDPSRINNVPWANHKLQRGIVSNSILESSVIYPPTSLAKKSTRKIPSALVRSKRDSIAAWQPEKIPLQKFVEDRGYPSIEESTGLLGNRAEPNRNQRLDAPPMFFYNSDGRNFAGEPYALYYPVVYVQGNRKMMQYFPIPNSRFQYYDPVILDPGSLKSPEDSHVERDHVQDDVSGGQAQNLPFNEFPQEREGDNSPEKYSSNLANQGSPAVEEQQAQSSETNMQLNANAAVDRSMQKKDVGYVQHSLPKHYMYDTVLRSDEYYDENPRAWQHGDFNEQEGLVTLSPPKRHNLNLKLNSRDKVVDAGQIDSDVFQEVPYPFGISGTSRKKRNSSL